MLRHVNIFCKHLIEVLCPNAHVTIMNAHYSCFILLYLYQGEGGFSSLPEDHYALISNPITGHDVIASDTTSSMVTTTDATTTDTNTTVTMTTGNHATMTTGTR